MPVEIRELVIRATVADAAPSQQKLEQLLARLKAELLDECLNRLNERAARAGER
jgi:hypothetical protein